MKGLALFLNLIAPLLLWGSPALANNPPYPQVYRTFLPNAGPSAFAVKLSEALVLIYDPLQGGVQQAVTGQLDLTPTLRAKINEPAVLNGTSFYQETLVQPLRTQTSKEMPVRKFLGYHYEANQVRFRYNVDGVQVEEILKMSPSGRGFSRTWHYTVGSKLTLQLEAQSYARITLPNGSQVLSKKIDFPATGTFTLNIDPTTSR